MTEDVVRLDARDVADAVYGAIGDIAFELRDDYRRALAEAMEDARRTMGADDAIGRRAVDVMDAIFQNDGIGKRDRAPICQDTGSVWVCLEIGPDIQIQGDIFSQVDAAVARAYTDGKLRMSIVADALFDRTNTGNNTPAFCEIRTRRDAGATLHVMLKGGGSDNASRVVMCPPGAGRAGIIEEVLACAREKAANACPPLVIGVGIGATFDKVAGLAKHALLRPVGSAAQSAEAAGLEKELMRAVNATNIGPGALGGVPTALAVHVETAPCHIAALPLAINMGCCAMRSSSVDLA